MISEDLFIKTIENIQKQQEKVDRFNKALDELSDGYPIFDSNNLYLESLLEILKSVFHDENEWIEWWLWENVEKTVWFDDGTEIDLTSSKSLYNFLIQNMIENGCSVVIDEENNDPVEDVEPTEVIVLHSYGENLDENPEEILDILM